MHHGERELKKKKKDFPDQQHAGEEKRGEMSIDKRAEARRNSIAPRRRGTRYGGRERRCGNWPSNRRRGGGAPSSQSRRARRAGPLAAPAWRPRRGEGFPKASRRHGAGGRRRG